MHGGRAFQQTRLRLDCRKMSPIGVRAGGRPSGGACDERRLPGGVRRKQVARQSYFFPANNITQSSRDDAKWSGYDRKGQRKRGGRSVRPLLFQPPSQRASAAVAGATMRGNTVRSTWLHRRELWLDWRGRREEAPSKQGGARPLWCTAPRALSPESFHQARAHLRASMSAA
jgi:hypothetical protein